MYVCSLQRGRTALPSTGVKINQSINQSVITRLTLGCVKRTECEATTTDNRVGSKDSDDSDSTAKKITTRTGKNINEYIY